MFILQGAILYIFGWMMMLGSSDLTALPTASYNPVDKIVASKDQEHVPFSYDAVLDVNQSFTYETPSGKTFPRPFKLSENTVAPLNYQLSYYTIGQQIMVNLTTKAIIFPFHWFT
ncbi:hypothetical protein [Gelidibacter salicanalis]|uniref:Uncharacterized protein n=1 Tax=Gelidibacter salicanalis TaxID=291193 RepID=A0A934KVI2_9FLAO|nr:hypothetical protein [Gelidibacter salicanalis]MBJ7882086.1 hypothetical protein [Gelidibacter salicanalis]